MKPLDLAKVNSLAPYQIVFEDGEFRFETDHDIRYAISFDKEEMRRGIDTYWFNLSNRSGKASPGDKKIRMTIVLLIEEFFCKNSDVLLYMCDSANDQQAMRARLFLRWFNSSGHQIEYFTRTEKVMDEEEENYIAIIVKRNHPKFEEIISLYERQIEMFRANKPQ
ncbi:MAG: hypothetical protein IJV36_06510 [Prevotella sp.]|nr:hypothetical protein [Prevotella sp.]